MRKGKIAMKKLRYVVPIIMLLALTACSAPTYNIRLESGRPIANPNYVLKSTGETRLMATFWFTEFSSVVDKDGTKVFLPNTLDMHEVFVVNKGTEKLTVTLEVYNPDLVEYSVSYDFKASDRQSHMLAGVSDLIHRIYTIELPLDDKDGSSYFAGTINVEDTPLFMLGPFNYRKGGIKEARQFN